MPSHKATTATAVHAATEGSAKVRASSKAFGSGLLLAPSVPSKVAAGQSVVIGLGVSGVVASEGATVLVRDATSAKVLHSAQLTPGDVQNLQIPFSAASEGMHYLDVITTQAGRSSVQQIAVKVGNAPAVQLQKSGHEIVTPSGERIISMPSK